MDHVLPLTPIVKQFFFTVTSYIACYHSSDDIWSLHTYKKFTVTEFLLQSH